MVDPFISRDPCVCWDPVEGNLDIFFPEQVQEVIDFPDNVFTGGSLG